MDVEDIKSALCLLRHIRHFRVKNEQRRYVTLQAMGVCTRKLWPDSDFLQ